MELRGEVKNFLHDRSANLERLWRRIVVQLADIVCSGARFADLDFGKFGIAALECLAERDRGLLGCGRGTRGSCSGDGRTPEGAQEYGGRQNQCRKRAGIESAEIHWESHES